MLPFQYNRHRTVPTKGQKRRLRLKTLAALPECGGLNENSPQQAQAASVWGGEEAMMEEGCHWEQALKFDALTPVLLLTPS